MMLGRAGFDVASQGKKIALKGLLLNLSEPHGSESFSRTTESTEVRSPTVGALDSRFDSERMESGLRSN